MSTNMNIHVNKIHNTDRDSNINIDIQYTFLQYFLDHIIFTFFCGGSWFFRDRSPFSWTNPSHHQPPQFFFGTAPSHEVGIRNPACQWTGLGAQPPGGFRVAPVTWFLDDKNRRMHIFFRTKPWISWFVCKFKCWFQSFSCLKLGGCGFRK